MLTVLSNTGAVTASIAIPQDASFRFISSLVQVTDSNGACRYYTVDGDTENVPNPVPIQH